MQTLAPFPNRKPSAIVIGEPWAIEGVFGSRRLAHLAQRTTFLSEPISPEQWPAVRDSLRDVEVIFGTWSLPSFSTSDADLMGNLRAVFYSAGTVRYFARPLLGRGVEIFTAASANAVPVAEFALGQILLANKGYFRVFRASSKSRSIAPAPGNYGATVALLGAGEIGQALIARLRAFDLRILVFDPYLTEEQAEALGVEKVTLEEAFARGDVVSNHLADLPATKGMLRGSHFASMRTAATFLNTGRGATVCEPELIEALLVRPDLTALLDVTQQEPLPLNSPLWTMENVNLSPHIAGSIGAEKERMADWTLGEFDSWCSGGPVRGRVIPEMFDRMA